MIPRQQMPQIPTNKIHEFKEFLATHNVTSEFKDMRVGSLKPIQKEINKSKVQDLIDKDSESLTQPLVVSEDGFIMDGLHRGVALTKINPDSEIMCLVCNAPIMDLIQLGHEFDGSFTKSVREFFEI